MYIVIVIGTVNRNGRYDADLCVLDDSWRFLNKEEAEAFALRLKDRCPSARYFVCKVESETVPAYGFMLKAV